MPGRAGCPCPCAVPRCVTAALPCHAGSAVAQRRWTVSAATGTCLTVDGVTTGTVCLGWVCFLVWARCFLVFLLFLVCFFFLRDAVKASHSVYINRDGEPSSGKQNPFPMLLFQSWDTVCSQQLRQRRLLMFSRCWSGKQDGSFTPGWPDRACSQP